MSPTIKGAERKHAANFCAHGMADDDDVVVAGTRVGLDESAVRLIFEISKELLLRQNEPIEPRRQFGQWSPEVWRLENQERTDHLDPGRT